MLSALSHLLRRRNPQQLELVLDHVPTTAAELLERLRAYGLPARIEHCRLTRNRTVMVSFSGRELRIHRGYLGAPPAVLARRAWPPQEARRKAACSTETSVGSAATKPAVSAAR